VTVTHSGPSPLKGLAREFEHAGLEVRKLENWLNNGYEDFRPRRTGFHHTASAKSGGNTPSLGVVLNGREGIPGPLCNFLIGRNGQIVCVAGGKANHFGLGGPIRGIPKDSGNLYVIGFEVENDGVGEPWERDLIQACDLAFAVSLDFMDEHAGAHLAHKEYAEGRKFDPARLDMDHDRDRVRAILKDGIPRKGSR
jgi:hypothetical protein